MAIPAGNLTGTSDISALVKTAYDQYVRMALRSIPVMRAIADVKPVQQAMPGSSVVFSIYSDLAQATSTLTETSDVSSIALGNPNQVTVTLNEYGSAVTTTKKLNLTSFNDVDSALADIIAYNSADSIDSVVATVLTGGSNVIYAGTSGATSTNTVTATDVMSVAAIREAVTELRTNKAVPRINDLYAAYLHPRQAADLRAESGTGGFQALTQYVDRTPFVAGAVGVIEGAFVIETPRVPYAANTQSPAVNVYKAIIAGREALAEAQGQDISTVIGPEIDALRRFRTIGWYYMGGFARLREAALYRIESASSY
jgi:N4-gp56 family major capsid protein